MAEEVRTHVEYDRLCCRYDRESVDELLPTHQVRECFHQLGCDHLEYVIESLRSSTAQTLS